MSDYVMDMYYKKYQPGKSDSSDRREPYMIVELDPMRSEVIKRTLDYYGFDCLNWGNSDSRVLVSIEWKRYSKVGSLPVQYGSKNNREYTMCEFMNEVLKPFADKEMERIPSYTCNRETIEKSERCVCINCFSRFSPEEITEWAEDEDGDTACCPYCYVDMVIPEPAEKMIPLCYLERWHKRLLGCISDDGSESGAVIMCEDPSPDLTIDEMRDILRNVTTESEIAYAYALANNKFWWIEDDIYDYEEGTEEWIKADKAITEWSEIMCLLENRILDILKKEGITIPETGRTAILSSFMERNNYRDGALWWVRKDEK